MSASEKWVGYKSTHSRSFEWRRLLFNNIKDRKFNNMRIYGEISVGVAFDAGKINDIIKDLVVYLLKVGAIPISIKLGIMRSYTKKEDNSHGVS